MIITHSKIKRLNEESFTPWAMPRSHNSLQLTKDNSGNTVLISLELELFFSIKNHQDYTSSHTSPKKTIDLITKQEINHYFTAHNFNETINSYDKIINRLKYKLDKRFKKEKLGVELEELNVVSLTPPAPIANLYKQKIIMKNEVESKYQLTLSKALHTRSQAQSQALNIVNKAQNEAYEDKILYIEERKYFANKQNAFKQKPNLYKTIELMNLLEQSGKNPKVQKIIILSNKDKILNLDFKRFLT